MLETTEAATDIGAPVPRPLQNLGTRMMQLAAASCQGRAYPVYGGWSLIDGELRLTVFGPQTAKASELLGRFD